MGELVGERITQLMGELIPQCFTQRFGGLWSARFEVSPLRLGEVKPRSLQWPLDHFSVAFAKQVWKIKDQIADSAQRDRQIDLKVGHWTELMGLKEIVLRRLAAEVLRTELAMNCELAEGANNSVKRPGNYLGSTPGERPHQSAPSD